jgi:hypothetical protein
MKKIYAFLFILFLGVLACEKEDFIGAAETTEVDKNDNFKIVKLDGYIPTVSTRSGGTRPVFYRNSLTTSNYLQGGNADYILTQNAFNKDSVDNIIFKRSGANATISGILHGTYTVVVNFKDDTTHEGEYYVKQGLDYYMFYPGGTNYYTQIDNFITLEKQDSIITNYYDYGFGKFKDKFQYKIIAIDTVTYEKIPSRISNSSTFTFVHVP